MHLLTDLPEHEQFISAIAFDGQELSLRVSSDYHVGLVAMAYAISARDVRNPESAATFLQAVADEKDYIYLIARGDALLIQRENGESLLIEADSLSGQPEELNAIELRAALDRVTAWYEADSEILRTLLERLDGLRSILSEQARRVELKSAAHAPDSAAGVLYSQQMQFIQRLLKVTES